MFKSFFLSQRWMHWSILGSIFILVVTWCKVQLDVRINDWFGTFYDIIQNALGDPGSVELDDFMDACLTFAKIAATYVVVAVLLEFFVRHYVFRWRTALNDHYMSHWHPTLRNVEGASQRVQEDTMRFARIVEGLGVSFIRSIMTLVAFLPLLGTLSEYVTELPWVGQVQHSLVLIAVVSALSGTVLLAVVGIKLPGLEYQNQAVEASYRKELVLGEDHEHRADPPTVAKLFDDVRCNYFNLYKHYLYFDIAKWSYLQFTVIVPYVALGPTIVSGNITLGIMKQVVHVFDRVESSFQFLVYSWSTIVELISIYKRLHAFETQIQEKCVAASVATVTTLGNEAQAWSSVENDPSLPLAPSPPPPTLIPNHAAASTGGFI